MRFIFLDDSRQMTPTRENTGPLVAIGGFSLVSDVVRTTEARRNRLRAATGFPPNEPFKRSPGGISGCVRASSKTDVGSAFWKLPESWRQPAQPL